MPIGIDVVNLSGSLVRPGCTLRYADEPGSEPAVVLLHGAGLDHRIFDAQRRDLRRVGRRVVSWDLRGHGQSRPNDLPFAAEIVLADLRELLDHLQLARPVLVGHSLGGNIAQEAVRRDPDGFAGLAVLGSSWNAGPLSALQRILLTLGPPALRIFPESLLPRIMSHVSAQTADARAYATRAFSRLTKEQFIEVWDAGTALVSPDAEYRTPVPLSLIRGAQDTIGNIAEIMPEWAAAECTEDQIVIEAGHIVTLDAPEDVSMLLMHFLEKIEERV